MAGSRYWFEHKEIPHSKWVVLANNIRTMLFNCPDHFSQGNRRYRHDPLKGALITASYRLTESNGEWFDVIKLDHSGQTGPVSEVCDVPHIVLNGHGSLGAGFLVIGTAATSAPQRMDTQGKPYELFVAATLLLANSLMPGLWDIFTDAPVEVLEAARDFAAATSGREVEIPDNIAQRTPRTHPLSLNVTTPQGLDFRA